MNIGIVGAGAIVKERHMPGFQEDGHVRIVAVCNSTPESARSFCAEFAPDAEVIDEYYDVVAHPEVEAVVHTN